MSRSLVVALALVAAGCTTLDLDDTWAKPNVGAAQMSREDWECRREVDASAPRTEDQLVGCLADLVRVQLEEKLRDETYAKCMEARGYVRTSKPFSAIR